MSSYKKCFSEGWVVSCAPITKPILLRYNIITSLKRLRILYNSPQLHPIFISTYRIMSEVQ